MANLQYRHQQYRHHKSENHSFNMQFPIKKKIVSLFFFLPSQFSSTYRYIYIYTLKNFSSFAKSERYIFVHVLPTWLINFMKGWVELNIFERDALFSENAFCKYSNVTKYNPLRKHTARAIGI